MTESWMATHTFHHSKFKDLERLIRAKNRKQLRISACLPTLNEEHTIGKEIIILKSELMVRYPLLDEIVVIDSGSTDKTVQIARSYGADVYLSSEILPQQGTFKGKGENLWKALYVTTGDIIVYLDADIKNIHHRFAYGLIGPLLQYDHLKFTKAFYDRPISTGKNTFRPTGGGRVTELVTRPLFSLFAPQLTQILQPLSGEYAGYRHVFEKIPFPIGYGIETSMLLDIWQRWGLDVIAQVDLDRRIHRNQDTKALGRMSFVIMKTLLERIQKLGLVELNQTLFSEIIQYNLVKKNIEPDPYTFDGIERPPMMDLTEYQIKFDRSPAEVIV